MTPDVEPLEPRLLCSADPRAVTLHRVGGTSRSTPGKTVWVVLGGFGAEADDKGTKSLAAAVDAASSKDRVMIADWTPFARKNASGRATERDVNAAAASLADQIAATGVHARYVNLVGISMGSLVADRTAAALRKRGGVNAIVALDPATVKLGKSPAGKVLHAAYHLAANSKHALAFNAGDRLAPATAALTADDSVRIQFGTRMTDVVAHQSVFELFTNILTRAAARKPGPISRLFSLTKIAAGDLPEWKKDRYDPVKGQGGFEAMLYTTGKPGGTLAPAKVSYVDGDSGRRRDLNGG
jgi:pimeloyl-ACP methyl ester carboxylesterase